MFQDASKIRRVIEAYVEAGGSVRTGRPLESEREGRQAGRRGEEEREGRQAGGGGEEDGDCENKGYETEIQEICEKVLDTECFNVTVTKTRKDIKKTCRTRVGLTWCHHVLPGVTREMFRLIRSVGRLKLRSRKRNAAHDMLRSKEGNGRGGEGSDLTVDHCRCSHLYQTVEERSVKEECEEEIKTVCEEKIVVHRPVYPPPPVHPPPVHPTPEPIFGTTPHPYAGPIPQPRDVTITPRGAGQLDRSRRETNPESRPGPQLSMFNLMFKAVWSTLIGRELPQ